MCPCDDFDRSSGFPKRILELTQTHLPFALTLIGRRAVTCSSVCSAPMVLKPEFSHLLSILRGSQSINGNSSVQLMTDWKGWDRLRRPPNHHDSSRVAVRSHDVEVANQNTRERSRWGVPESQIRQLLFQKEPLMLETLANLLETSEARASFRYAHNSISPSMRCC